MASDDMASDDMASDDMAWKSREGTEEIHPFFFFFNFLFVKLFFCYFLKNF